MRLESNILKTSLTDQVLGQLLKIGGPICYKYAKPGQTNQATNHPNRLQSQVASSSLQ
uniref:Uncharacterized protein n=1 Tax=Arundo donax TaxID=35708 RepID=A0A0A9C566_ARUDO